MGCKCCSQNCTCKDQSCGQGCQCAKDCKCPCTVPALINHVAKDAHAQKTANVIASLEVRLIAARTVDIKNLDL
ncbi:unnamed protein product [Chironomus riparius]|uniref:Metallothionein n=1 Tax=Chironomus riparius TaxID=315576 RepID=A0A9N9RYA3_9DIPT|nr:unnamed protein product [Chironomus riparius]